MPGSLSRVTGCRWRHAGCKGGFAAPDDAATDGLVSAPLHSAGFAAGRGRSARLGTSETNRRRGRKSPARVRCRQMDKREIEELRQKVGCAALLEKDGWKVDVKESTRRAIKYRRDSNIIIVIHEGRGWFDPLSPAKGDVFSLAEHLGADGFV